MGGKVDVFEGVKLGVWREDGKNESTKISGVLGVIKKGGKVGGLVGPWGPGISMGISGVPHFVFIAGYLWG